ncbi:MAG: hypothetical protein PHN82_07315 [bacterium]|nr:hypothetical protein [bacterium]
MHARMTALRDVTIGSVLGIIPFETIGEGLSVDAGPLPVREGDVILARVSVENGYRELLMQDVRGRGVHLYPDDLLAGVAGLRQSTTHYVGCLPRGMVHRGRRLHLLSEGGIIGEAVYCPARLAAPVLLDVEGVLRHDGGVLNMSEFAPARVPAVPLPPIVLVAGTSADIGKTTLASQIIRILSHRYALAVCSVVVSGTGSRADAMTHMEAGARHSHSFIEAGLSNTYGCGAGTLLPALENVVYRSVFRDRPDVIVGEMGGDFIWGNNDAILRASALMRAVRILIVVAGDAVSAIGARELLSRWGVGVPLVFAFSWLRSFRGIALRCRKYLPEECVDATDGKAVERFVRDVLLERIGAGRRAAHGLEVPGA